MDKKNYLPLILFIFSVSGGIKSQPILSPRLFEHLATGNGLSHDVVNCIVQDQYDFIWIGTANGLNRYDGYNFVHYQTIQGDTSSISGNFIKHIFIDSKGLMWIATTNGLNCYNPVTGQFKNYKHQKNNPASISSNLVTYVYEDRAGNIWAGATKTLEKLDTKTGIFTHYNPPAIGPPDENFYIEGIIEYNNDLFVSVWGVGPYRFNRQSSEFTPIATRHKFQGKRQWIHNFFVNSKGELFATDGVFLKYDPAKDAFIPVVGDEFADDHLSIQCIAETANQAYILGTAGNGIKIYNAGLNFNAASLLDKDNSTYLNNFVNAVCVGKSGEVWIGTAGNGMFKWDINRKKFDGFKNDPGNKKSISANYVTGVSAHEPGKLWLTTRYNGVNVFDIATRSFSRITHTSKGLNTNNAKSIFIDRQGNKWIGTWGGGLNRMDAQNGSFTYFKLGEDKATTLLDNFVTGITQAPNDNIWVATTRGISVIDYKNGRHPIVKSFEYKQGGTDCPGGLRTDAILCDKKGTVWIGTDANGISRYDPSTNIFTHYDVDFSTQNNLGGNKINTIYEDNKGQIWSGCAGGGLNLFVPESNSFKYYSEKDGLPGNEIRSIVDDKKGNLWIGTDKGLSVFTIQEKIFKNYNKEDGLLSNQFTAQAIAISETDGKIYAGTYDGLVVFHPDSIKNNNYVPPVYISSFKKYLTRGNKTITENIKGIEHLERITIPYTENTFSVTFVSLSYSNSSKNQYMYQLTGLNNNWVSLGNTRELTFSNLPHGKYELKVKASNSDLVWNEKATTLEIIISPPWWLTWWAYTLYGIGIAGLFYLFIKYRVKQGVLKVKALEKIRTKISSDLHDDVGTILSGLAMQSQVLALGANDEVKTSLNEISNMSREAMEHMRDTVWAMDSRKDRYENLIDRMRDFAEKNLAAKKMTHEFIIEDLDTRRFVDPEKRQAINLIFKEAVTNIIKHSDGNHAVIRFGLLKNNLHLSVFDNGSIKKTSGSDGLGLSNMKMRAEKIGGRLTSKYDNGFLVELIV